MRKTLLLSLLALIVLSVMGAGIAAAQDKQPIEFGQWVEGELSESSPEIKYSFNGTAGQAVLVEMIPKPGTFDLDPMVILRDSDGDVLGTSDDFTYPLSLVVAEITSNEEYVILATRSGGKDGTSTGEYWIRVSNVEPIASGTKLDVTITSNSDNETPNVFVIRPESDGPVKIGFAQQISELFASLDLSIWQDDSYGNSILSMDNTAKISAATFSVELEAGNFYVLTIARSFSSFSFDEAEATVTVTIN